MKNFFKVLWDKFREAYAEQHKDIKPRYARRHGEVPNKTTADAIKLHINRKKK